VHRFRRKALRRSSGTHPGLREQLPWPEGKPFRILSIDGGGIRGILPAAVLSELEEKYTVGRSAGDYFDLITGTSTGGIIALALSLGMRAREILQIYTELGPRIFPRSRYRLVNAWRSLRRYRHYAYDPAPLKDGLTRVFGNATLGETRRRLCVPAFDRYTEVFIFKTPHHPDYQLDWRERMVTAAMATAAAPAYFPVYRDRSPTPPYASPTPPQTFSRYFADGGVWASNPVMIGLVDALACYRLERRQVHILSLGTADMEMRITDAQLNLGGLWHWREVIHSAMHLQSQNALGQAGLLIGRDQLVRVNAPPMSKMPIDLDDYERAITELPPLASRLVEALGDVVSDRFLTAAAEPYIAFHGTRRA